MGFEVGEEAAFRGSQVENFEVGVAVRADFFLGEFKSVGVVTVVEVPTITRGPSVLWCGVLGDVVVRHGDESV